MKLLKVLIFLSIIVLSGCIKEDLSDCPTGNVSLTFRYTGNTLDDLSWFNKMIDRVNLYVFDHEGKLVINAVQQLENFFLSKSQTELWLEPGNYTIICWGNIFDNTLVSNYTTIMNGRVNHPDYGTIGKTLATQDHNYYGTLEITVPQNGKVAGEIKFKGAHINLEIVMKGWEMMQTSADFPYVEIQNVMPLYTIDMLDTAPYSYTYVPEITRNNNESYIVASLQTFRFADDNPLVVVVKNQSHGKTFASINLKKAMEDSDITVNGLNEATVRLILDFTDYGKDLSVKISVEGWSKKTPIPEL